MKRVNYGYDNTLYFDTDKKDIEQITSLDFETALDLLEVYLAEHKGAKSTFPKGRSLSFPFAALRYTDETGTTPTVQDEIANLAFSWDEKEIIRYARVDMHNGYSVVGDALWDVTQVGFGATEAETYLEGTVVMQGGWRFVKTSELDTEAATE